MSWSERFMVSFFGICGAGVVAMLVTVALTSPAGRLILAVMVGALGLAALVATATGDRN